MQSRSRDELNARLDDYAARASHGKIAVSRFLTPGEQKEAERLLAARGLSEQAIFFGGYPDAERKCLFLIPDFYAAVPGLLPETGGNPADTLPDPDAAAVAAVRVTGSGYRVLAHRDYLGSLLALGLEREVIGDIAIQNEREAVVFTLSHLVPFLTESLSKIASDTVRCTPYTPDESFTDGRVWQPLTGTVASPRLDCVVAELTNLSREAAQTAIRSEQVEVDFEPADRTDLLLTPPAILSIRGYGRFRLCSFDGETKKGRLRMRAEKLI